MSRGLNTPGGGGDSEEGEGGTKSSNRFQRLPSAGRTPAHTLAHTGTCSVAFAKQMFSPGALDMPRTWSNVTIASRGAGPGCIAMPNE